MSSRITRLCVFTAKLKRNPSKLSRQHRSFSSVSNRDGYTPRLSHYRPHIPPVSHTNSAKPLTSKGVDFDARPLYMDVQATAPVDPRVIDVMNSFYVEHYGNPHSRTHMFGWETEDSVENARKQISDLIGANPKEILFTSGATESNNLAIKGVAQFVRRKPRKHIITVQTEHKCVLDSCRQLEMEGFKVTYLPVQNNGIIDLNVLESHMTDDTLLVSCMHVNNEIGVIQPIGDIGKLCRSKGVFFHCDAAQGLGKIPIDVNAMNIDLMSMSGHKIYGPKGIGALYIRRRPRVQLKPLINGGGQERGMRSGTLPAPLCVGFGAACQIASECMEEDKQHVTYLADKLINGLGENLEEMILNGDSDQRYPGNVNLSFAFVEGESLLMGMKNICVSSGSACTSASLEPSYVLRAIGVSDDLAHTSVRFGIGRFTTEEEIDFVVRETTENVTRLREMSPLYELFKAGMLDEIQWAQH